MDDCYLCWYYILMTWVMLVMIGILVSAISSDRTCTLDEVNSSNVLNAILSKLWFVLSISMEWNWLEESRNKPFLGTNWLLVQHPQHNVIWEEEKLSRIKLVGFLSIWNYTWWKGCALLMIYLCINYNNTGRCIYMCFVGYTFTFKWRAWMAQMFYATTYLNWWSCIWINIIELINWI